MLYVQKIRIRDALFLSVTYDLFLLTTICLFTLLLFLLFPSCSILWYLTSRLHKVTRDGHLWTKERQFSDSKSVESWREDSLTWRDFSENFYSSDTILMILSSHAVSIWNTHVFLSSSATRFKASGLESVLPNVSFTFARCLPKCEAWRTFFFTFFSFVTRWMKLKFCR